MAWLAAASFAHLSIAPFSAQAISARWRHDARAGAIPFEGFSPLRESVAGAALIGFARYSPGPGQPVPTDRHVDLRHPQSERAEVESPRPWQPIKKMAALLMG